VKEEEEPYTVALVESREGQPLENAGSNSPQSIEARTREGKKTSRETEQEVPEVECDAEVEKVEEVKRSSRKTGSIRKVCGEVIYSKSRSG